MVARKVGGQGGFTVALVGVLACPAVWVDAVIGADVRVVAEFLLDGVLEFVHCEWLFLVAAGFP